MNERPLLSPVMMDSDPLGACLHLLDIKGLFYCQAYLTAPWGIEVPALADGMMFQIVTEGEAWLDMAGEPRQCVRPGWVNLLPHGCAHAMMSAPGVACQALSDVPVEPFNPYYEHLSYGGGGAPTKVLYGVMTLSQQSAHMLSPLLPPLISLPFSALGSETWLAASLDLLRAEGETLRPGGGAILRHICDILVLHTLRAWLSATTPTRPSWLKALKDPLMGPLLSALHHHPSADWDLARMCHHVGQSRSVFCQRFSDLTGQSPMMYLKDLRLRRSHDQLLSSDQSLSEIAYAAGYGSDAAFSRAFKAVFGHAPGALRRAQSQRAAL
ncbi:AraC family transcriptional regulator [Woodsholea maritima]|uniref:AraC family transcriptional regulator n=1 Tax=Woodsholea maritima TaxID=240237 RepID=UPI000364B6E2|nr:AraC family transcriptional regulator [Woodsholea maritima]